MAYSVLVVDDSRFFRRHLTEMINASPQFRVIGTAETGNEAVALAQELKPDVITMDYEMPGMDGISAVRAIMSSRPTPILMLSSLTYEGAKISLDALEAGALDFLPKKFDKIAAGDREIRDEIHRRLLGVVDKMARQRASASSSTRPTAVSPGGVASRPAVADARQADTTPAPSLAARAAAPAASQPCKLVILAASTGGPVALAEVLKALPANYPVPIVVVQHMPPMFTREFAERLNRVCALTVKEAEDGDALAPGKVLLAPGGKQLLFSASRNGTVSLRDEQDARVLYQPCADITFASAASCYGGSVLAVVMTGMGDDGCKGARLLREKGARIWTQDEESCVVYGMPAAIDRQQLSDRTVKLAELAQALLKVN